MPGRKKKININLESESHTDYAKLSVDTKILTWEYKNPKNKEIQLLKIPLSVESSLKYWEEKMPDDPPTSKNMITRIRKRSDNRMIFLYDFYSEREKLLNELVYSLSSYLKKTNKNREVAGQYHSTLNIILKYITEKEEDIYSVFDMNENFQKKIYNEIKDTNSIYFTRKERKTYSTQIIRESLLFNDLNCYLDQEELLVKKTKRKGQKPKEDVSQEVAIQILAYSYKEIKYIIKKRKDLNKWRKEYKDKDFDSLKNFAYTFINYPKCFDKYTPLRIKNSAISGYRKRYSDLCEMVHGINLNKLEWYEIKKLSKDGVNISELHKPKIMAWFIDDILNGFPYCNNIFITPNTPMIKYSKWKLKSCVYNHMKPYGIKRQTLIDVFYETLSKETPSRDDLTPFLLFWMLQSGTNQEAILNLNSKERINGKFDDVGEYKIDKDTFILKSYKARGTNDNYYFTLNSKEKGGLYDILIFLKEYLSPLWNVYLKENSQFSPFWIYRSHKNQSATKKINVFNRNSLKEGFKSFLNRNIVIDKNGNVVEYIQLSKFRNTFITTAEFEGATIEEIQNWVRHDSFDTRFTYYGNSEDQKNRNYKAIYAIQESIIRDAREFKGELVIDDSISRKENFVETLTCSCSNSNQPSFKGAKKFKNNELCIDFDMCLLCENSRIFKEHLPFICLRILQYEELMDKQTPDEWENNFSLKYKVAKSVLRKWICDGGEKNEISNAFVIANSGKINLPLIFPQGKIKIQGKRA